MLPKVYREFERICARRGASDGSVLEIGAVPSPQSLLCMPLLTGAREKLGVNLDGPRRYHDFEIVKGNGNRLDFIEDNRFDVVLCNAVLEHDKFFWKTVAEMKRVAKPGGLIVVGAPGYARARLQGLHRWAERVGRLPLVGRIVNRESLLWLTMGTLTIGVHNHPGDYYRFTEQSFAEVVCQDLIDVEVHAVVVPPYLVGAGTKPRLAAA
jgi:SAM-dependent methyltransferase